MGTVGIQHFSDVLCVWAYVSQIRIDELKRQFGSQIRLEYHYVPVFGHARSKLEAQWSPRGGIEAYSRHVQEVVAQFDHCPVHPEVWVRNTPSSSMPAHLFLCALRLLEDLAGGEQGATLFERAAWEVRRAFFVDALDVSRQQELLAIAERLALPVAEVVSILESGAAHARLAEEIVMARDHSVRASPTLQFNEGRQVLTGNVGYRVIEANVRELLRTPGGSSWC
jgi:predicted DsbA family dithiol-disulfide isomerase